MMIHERARVALAKKHLIFTFLFLICLHAWYEASTISTVFPQGWSVFACVDLQVMKSTGFFRGLYTSQELDAKSIQVCTYMMCVCFISMVPVWWQQCNGLGGVSGGFREGKALAASNVMQCNGLGGIFTLCLYMHVEEDPVPFVVNWLVDYSYNVLCSCQ